MIAYTSGMRLTSRAGWVLVLAGLLVQGGAVGFALWRTGDAAGYAFRSPDGGEYYRLARNLAERGVFSQGEGPPFAPDTWRTPGYPLFLAPVMVYFGNAPVVLVLAQGILSIVNALLLFHTARGFLGDGRALVASLVFLVEPYRVFYSLWLLSTTLLVTVLLLTWLAWREGVATRAGGWLAIAGLLTGLAVLIWPGCALVPVLLLIGLVVYGAVLERRRWERGGRWWTWRGGLLFALANLAVVGPWVARNHRVAGVWALSDQSGVVLAYFKAAEVVLWRQGRAADRYMELSTDAAHSQDAHTVWEMIDRELRARLADLPPERHAALGWSQLAQGNAAGVDSFRVSHELRRIAWGHLKADPVAAVVCGAWRVADNLTFPLSLALAPPAGVAVQRMRAAALGGVYLVLCAAAAIRLVYGGWTFAGWYFPLAVGMALALVVTPQVDPRFRVPMIPLLIVLALMPRAARSR